MISSAVCFRIVGNSETIPTLAGLSLCSARETGFALTCGESLRIRQQYPEWDGVFGISGGEVRDEEAAISLMQPWFVSRRIVAAEASSILPFGNAGSFQRA